MPGAQVGSGELLSMAMLSLVKAASVTSRASRPVAAVDVLGFHAATFPSSRDRVDHQQHQHTPTSSVQNNTTFAELELGTSG
jgi:hypothetical protein